MKTLKVTANTRWVAGTLPLPGVDPLAGTALLGVPSVYWERPLAREAAAGWREAGVLEAATPAEARECLAFLTGTGNLRWLQPPEPSLLGPWFGGMRFASAEDAASEWSAWGHGRWVLPELLVWRHGEGLYAAAFASEEEGGEDAVRSRLERIKEAFPATYRHPQAEALELKHRGDRPPFEALVQRALDGIEAGSFKKVVLARAIDVTSPEPFPLADVISRLREENPRCATFLFTGPHGEVFTGATPETLCRLEGQRLETEALAGSAVPDEAQALSGRDKDRREHVWVVDAIADVLRPLSASLSVDAEPSVLALRNVVHLRTGVCAELLPSVVAADAVLALHPTPAVGGSPRGRALGFILEHEGMDRGWYAGPVGWVGPGRAHLAVALRSAWIKGAKARLYVGAGIVAGSKPEAEWDETELKSLTVLRALGGGLAGRQS